MSKIACITGDVHHNLWNSCWDQYEATFALHFCETILAKNASATLFVTGKCARNRPKKIQRLQKYNQIEVGGHTYGALSFAPKYLNWLRDAAGLDIDLSNAHHQLYKKLCGTYYGPKVFQRWDINRTVQALNDNHIIPNAWRTHAYQGDELTYNILDDIGFFVVSDERADSFSIYRETGDLWHATITGPTDEGVEPGNDNETYRDSVLQHILSASNQEEPILLQMHPKRQAMMDFEHMREVIDMLFDRGYRFKTITGLTTDLTGESPTRLP